MAEPTNPTTFLVPPSPHWRGTIGKLIKPEDFAAYVDRLVFHPFLPEVGVKIGSSPPSPAIVLHNTAAPNHSQWAGHDVVDRLKNITADYQSKKPAWMGGPHLFIDWHCIWLFTPLWQQGTHSPSWNQTSWGIEMVGDYDKEPFNSGDGALVRDNAALAVAVLLKRLKLKPTSDTLRLHKEDHGTTHACPGVNVDKGAFLVSASQAYSKL
jgi:hypothetical protein